MKNEVLVVTLTMTKDLKEKFLKETKKQGRSKANFLYQLIKKALGE